MSISKNLQMKIIEDGRVPNEIREEVFKQTVLDLFEYITPALETKIRFVGDLQYRSEDIQEFVLEYWNRVDDIMDILRGRNK